MSTLKYLHFNVEDRPPKNMVFGGVAPRNGRLLMQQAWQFLIHFCEYALYLSTICNQGIFRIKTGNPLSGSLTTGGEDAFA